MQIACYIFLKRRWDTDKPWLSALLEYYGLLRYKGQFLIFPEGTCSKNNINCIYNALSQRIQSAKYFYCKVSWTKFLNYET